jgi:hypothetical protein
VARGCGKKGRGKIEGKVRIGERRTAGGKVGKELRESKKWEERNRMEGNGKVGCRERWKIVEGKWVEGKEGWRESGKWVGGKCGNRWREVGSGLKGKVQRSGGKVESGLEGKVVRGGRKVGKCLREPLCLSCTVKVNLKKKLKIFFLETPRLLV